MPIESIDKKFAVWAVGFLTVLGLGTSSFVGSALWSLNSTVITLGMSQANLAREISDLKIQIDNGEKSKYSNEQALNDKTSILMLYSGLIPRLDNLEKNQQELRLWKASIGNNNLKNP